MKVLEAAGRKVGVLGCAGVLIGGAAAGIAVANNLGTSDTVHASSASAQSAVRAKSPAPVRFIVRQALTTSSCSVYSDYNYEWKRVLRISRGQHLTWLYDLDKSWTVVSVPARGAYPSYWGVTKRSCIGKPIRQEVRYFAPAFVFKGAYRADIRVVRYHDGWRALQGAYCVPQAGILSNLFPQPRFSRDGFGWRYGLGWRHHAGWPRNYYGWWKNGHGRPGHGDPRGGGYGRPGHGRPGGDHGRPGDGHGRPDHGRPGGDHGSPGGGQQGGGHGSPGGGQPGGGHGSPGGGTGAPAPPSHR